MDWTPVLDRLPLRRGRRTRKLRVLLGTTDGRALDALGSFAAEVERVEAFTTGGAYRRLVGCGLAVLDPGTLPETDGVGRDALAAVLASSGAAWCTPADFADRPSAWEARALEACGAIEALPPKAVAFANYSGGVGKTTCAIDLARFVAARLRLPAAVVEMKQGKSSLRALLDRDAPDLYRIITQDAAPARWNGVSLVPMEYRTARLLAGRPEAIAAALGKVKADHVLTVFDLEPDNEFARLALPLVDELYGLAAPRADAIENAAQALSDLAEAANGSRPRTALVVNQCRGPADRVALAGVERRADLPWLEAAGRFDGRLAAHLMKVVYPGWRR